MTPKTAKHTDDQLGELLDVEHRLEVRQQEAVTEAQRQIETARADANDSHERRQAELELAAAEEERADREVHLARLQAIAEDGAKRAAALRATAPERIDALAEQVVARLLAGEGAP